MVAPGSRVVFIFEKKGGDGHGVLAELANFSKLASSCGVRGEKGGVDAGIFKLFDELFTQKGNIVRKELGIGVQIYEDIHHLNNNIKHLCDAREAFCIMSSFFFEWETHTQMSPSFKKGQCVEVGDTYIVTGNVARPGATSATTTAGTEKCFCRASVAFVRSGAAGERWRTP